MKCQGQLEVEGPENRNRKPQTRRDQTGRMRVIISQIPGFKKRGFNSADLEVVTQLHIITSRSIFPSIRTKSRYKLARKIRLQCFKAQVGYSRVSQSSCWLIGCGFLLSGFRTTCSAFQLQIKPLCSTEKFWINPRAVQEIFLQNLQLAKSLLFAIKAVNRSGIYIPYWAMAATPLIYVIHSPWDNSINKSRVLGPVPDLERVESLPVKLEYHNATCIYFLHKKGCIWKQGLYWGRRGSGVLACPATCFIYDFPQPKPF